MSIRFIDFSISREWRMGVASRWGGSDGTSLKRSGVTGLYVSTLKSKLPMFGAIVAMAVASTLFPVKKIHAEEPAPAQVSGATAAVAAGPAIVHVKARKLLKKASNPARV